MCFRLVKIKKRKEGRKTAKERKKRKIGKESEREGGREKGGGRERERARAQAGGRPDDSDFCPEVLAHCPEPSLEHFGVAAALFLEHDPLWMIWFCCLHPF